MTLSGILKRIAVAALACSAAWANPPAQVGDSFFTWDSFSIPGGSTHQLIYLGGDGTCQVLYSSHALGPGNPVYRYDPSMAGTYTYAAPTPAQPALATLTFNFPSGSGPLFLQFIGDNTGVLQPGPFAAMTSFSFMLAQPNTFLTNVSNRVTLRPGDAAITGFVIGGSLSRLVLIRAIGPGLSNFGVSPVSQSPTLDLFSGTGTNEIGSGQAWGSVTGYDAQAMSLIFELMGAFPLQAGSKDVVYFALLAPGAYTVHTADASAPPNGGSALAEVYILPYSI